MRLEIRNAQLHIAMPERARFCRTSDRRAAGEFGKLLKRSSTMRAIQWRRETWNKLPFAVGPILSDFSSMAWDMSNPHNDRNLNSGQRFACNLAAPLDVLAVEGCLLPRQNSGGSLEDFHQSSSDRAWTSLPRQVWKVDRYRQFAVRQQLAKQEGSANGKTTGGQG